MAANPISHHGAGINVGTGERIGSAIAGTVLVMLALARPSLACIALAIGGATLLERSLTGRSVLYRTLGINTVVPETKFDEVLRASEDSFPASDPLSWTPVIGPGTPH